MADTEIPIYEIDPNKKYILTIPGVVSQQARERIQAHIREWLKEPGRPFLILMDGVKLVKVDRPEEERRDGTVSTETP